MTVRVGQAGLGEWGKNLARNFGDLTELTWLSGPARSASDVGASGRFTRVG